MEDLGILSEGNTGAPNPHILKYEIVKIKTHKMLTNTKKKSINFYRRFTLKGNKC